MILLVNSSLSFYPITLQHEFTNCKTHLCQLKISDVVFFFRHNFKRSLFNNIFLVSSHLCPLPLVRSPPQMTLFPSPTTFRLCTFLSSIPSTAAPFERYTISNTFNAISISWIILDEEGVPILDYHILLISRGMERIWESKMGTPSSARIIQDVNLALKALEIV